MLTATLTEAEDGWQVDEHGCLIAKSYYFDEWDRMVELSDAEVEAFISPYIGTEVTVMQRGEVYGDDGKYLGEVYI